jgi:Leucine-rich repeat (LRR) protein
VSDFPAPPLGGLNPRISDIVQSSWDFDIHTLKGVYVWTLPISIDKEVPLVNTIPSRTPLSVFFSCCVVACGGGSGGSAAPPGVLLSEIDFPDSNLAQCIADRNKTYSHQLTGLGCLSMGIADATGIEELPDLIALGLDNNQLTSIDLSANTALRQLTLDGNQFSMIDLD